MNKSEVFTRAWEIRRSAALVWGVALMEISWAHCLCEAWAEAQTIYIILEESMEEKMWAAMARGDMAEVFSIAAQCEECGEILAAELSALAARKLFLTGGLSLPLEIKGMRTKWDGREISRKLAK